VTVSHFLAVNEIRIYDVSFRQKFVASTIDSTRPTDSSLGYAILVKFTTEGS
jgi:hypothetical protein